MTTTYKIVKDANKKEAVEITDTNVQRRVIDKQSIVEEMVRLQALLDKFPKEKS